VTGAVGLGYSGGAQWLLLPLGWLLGDLIYWSIFPDRINRLAREAGAVTLSELLTYKLHGKVARLISITVSMALLAFLAAYAASQWLAGEKFLSGIVPVSGLWAIAIFGATIVLYSAIGGFRGSVYVDTMQAVVRLGGTLLALWVVGQAAYAHSASFWNNIHRAGAAFLNPFSGGLLTAASILGGYCAASIGFGLGQPQIISRYMAGASPQETKAARFIYIGFLQFTWLAMTIFGIVLRGVMPGLDDPEKGLSVFFQTNVNAVATGIIFADVFATIAGTSNGLLVAMAQTARRDLLASWLGNRHFSPATSILVTLGLGIGTILLSFVLPGSVFSIAIAAVSLIGAALAGVVMVKVFGWPHTATSVIAAIIAGIVAASAWRALGLSSYLNEAAVGILASLMMNALVSTARSNRQIADC
jgi:Na+/pantothenate symporter